MSKIWICLTDDWELRGNGLGTVLDLQCNPCKKLTEVYLRNNVSATFMVEVMQQLAFEQFSDKYKVIKAERDLWIESVKRMVDMGFDVQLHIHPQWHNAWYDGKYWHLDKGWNISDYSNDEIDKCVKKSKEYIEGLLCKWDKERKIVAFRGGSWGGCFPSLHVFSVLEKYGVKVDVTIVDGLYQNGESSKLDYRNIESPFLPYYPDYEDVRCISADKTEIIEIPTQSFIFDGYFFSKLLLNIYRVFIFVNNKLNILTQNAREEVIVPHFIVTNPFGNIKGDSINSSTEIFDICYDRPLIYFKRAFDIIIKKALNIQTDKIIPLILGNHTKNLTDKQLKRIDGLIRYIKKRYNKYINFVTLKDIVENRDELYIAIKKEMKT